MVMQVTSTAVLIIYFSWLKVTWPVSKLIITEYFENGGEKLFQEAEAH